MTDLWYLNTSSVDEQDVEELLSLLPAHMAGEILRFRYHADRRLKLLGKLMVKKYHTDLGQAFNWSHWKVTSEGKPFYDGKTNFNVSHSGEYVVVAFSEQQVGVDIEKESGFDVESVSTCFHPEEAQYMHNTRDANAAFFRLWTRKESYLKATGRGIVEGLHHENCLPDKLVGKDGIWYLSSLSLIPGYQVALCTEEPKPHIKLREVFPVEFKENKNIVNTIR